MVQAPIHLVELVEKAQHRRDLPDQIHGHPQLQWVFRVVQPHSTVCVAHLNVGEVRLLPLLVPGEIFGCSGLATARLRRLNPARTSPYHSIGEAAPSHHVATQRRLIGLVYLCRPGATNLPKDRARAEVAPGYQVRLPFLQPMLH